MSQELNYPLKFGVLGSLLDARVMRHKLQRDIVGIFGAMKRYIEQR